MFPQVCTAAGIIAGIAIISSILGSSGYSARTDERREMMKKLKEEGHDWKQITLVINEMDFRNRKGEKFTENELREEYAKMIADEEYKTDARSRRTP